MIRAIQIKNGYLTEMPGFHPGKIFEFSDGLNIFFGPNGCGKSSILKMLKAYSAIPEGRGGWSSMSDSHALGAQCVSHFPWVYREYSPGKCECTVLWDGVPSFYNDGDVKIDKWAWFTHNAILSEDGMSTEAEQMQLLIDKPSSGQYRMGKINKMFNMLDNPPDLTQPISGNAAHIAEAAFVRSLPRNGKPTLILDEPERALSLPKQLELFNLLVQMTEKYQIIIATHSPFVLFGLDAKLFNIQDGYDTECIQIFKDSVSKLTPIETHEEEQLTLF